MEDMFKNFFNDDFIDQFFKNFNTDKGEWEEKRWESPDGKSKGYYKIYISKPLLENKEVDKIKLLENKLTEALEKEDYLKAADLKKQIDSVKENESKTNELRQQLKLAVKQEDYLKAAELKKQIESI